MNSIMQTEKDSDIYLVYADVIDKSKVQEESYKKEDIEDVYIFTFRKIVTETTIEGVVKTDVKYILQKEKEKPTREIVRRHAAGAIKLLKKQDQTNIMKSLRMKKVLI